MTAEPDDGTEVELRRADGVATIVLTRPGTKNAPTSRAGISSWRRCAASRRRATASW
jgi:hypothetical protein